MNPLAGIPSPMTCGECGHLPNDHVDRAFGIACCPSIATTGFRARLCECSGWVLGTGEEIA